VLPSTIRMKNYLYARYRVSLKQLSSFGRGGDVLPSTVRMKNNLYARYRVSIKQLSSFGRGGDVLGSIYQKDEEQFISEVQGVPKTVEFIWKMR